MRRSAQLSWPRLFLNVRFQLLDQAGPAAGVILTGDGQIGETTVRHFHIGAVGPRREFPTHDGAPLGIVLPVGKPRISEKPRRVVLQHFTIAMKFADAVYADRALLGIIVPASPARRFHGEGFDRALGARPPLRYLFRIDERLKDALGRGRDVNLADDRVLIWRDN